MIVSHAHRFIYIKTKKTASSSIEAALSTLCGPDDVITPASEEIVREFEGERKAQNFRLKHPLVPKRPLLKRLLMRPERYYHPSIGFYEHMPAWRVKAYLGDAVWNAYFKFTFERNPWDREVSWYRFKTRREEPRPSFADFMKSRRRAFVDNWDLYTIDGAVAVDFVGAYERLDSDFAAVLERLGLAGRTALPSLNQTAKASGYRSYFDDRLRDLVGEWYRPEIAAFGYTF